MTTWIPDLANGSGPLYVRLADSIERDIFSGTIPAGNKLPPQRDLAYDLGVTVGTVGRAYGLVRERGLVSGEVGRGTYVLDRSTPMPQSAQEPLSGEMDGTRFYQAPAGKLRFDSTAAPQVGQSGAIGTILADIHRDHFDEVASYTRQFPDRWFEAGAQWLSRNKTRPAPDCIVPTLGVHAGVMAVISAVTAPGDSIAFERVTYSQLARSAGLIGRRTTLIASDDNGVIPEDFERVCAQRHPKIAFLMPTAQNPTLATMPEARRSEIAEIARRHNVWLVEDDLYGALTDDPTPLLADFAPERTFLVGGLSKSVAAGVRGGWVMCPPHFNDRIRVAHKMITGGMPFILAELCSRMVLSGAAAAMRHALYRIEIDARLSRSRATNSTGLEFVLAQPNVPPSSGSCFRTPGCPAPSRTRPTSEGVLVDDEDEYKPGRTEQVYPPHPRSASRHRASGTMSCRRLSVIRSLLDEGLRRLIDTFG
jgi:DNA-binding transcriptional MocR family regulator